MSARVGLGCTACKGFRAILLKIIIIIKKITMRFKIIYASGQHYVETSDTFIWDLLCLCKTIGYK